MCVLCVYCTVLYRGRHRRRPTMRTRKQRSEVAKWCFKLCADFEVSKPVAFRAICYMETVLNSDHPGVVDEINGLFGSSSESPDQPFVIYCLFLAAKTDSRDWDNTPLEVYFVTPQIQILAQRHGRFRARELLIEIDIKICTLIDWQLLPPTPFGALASMNGDAWDKFRAENIIERAVVERVHGVLLRENAIEVAKRAMQLHGTSFTGKAFRDVWFCGGAKWEPSSPAAAVKEGRVRSPTSIVVSRFK